MDLKQIEAAIVGLPTEDLTELMAWFRDYYARVWDMQIEDDLDSGGLDAVLGEVDREYEAGLARPL